MIFEKKEKINKPSFLFRYSFLKYDDLYSDLPIPRVKKISEWLDKLKNENIIINENEQNSLCYRSDEFINQHTKTHILFLGCSYTFGNGLKLEEIWSKQLYNDINKLEGCSGYFSLAYPGSSLISQVVLAFKYFKKYGNPNVIFLNAPDVSRFYYCENGYFTEAFYNKDYDLLEIICYQAYFMLEQYCVENNIQIFSTSWVYAEEKKEDNMRHIESIEKFDTFYKYDLNDMKEFINNYEEKENSFIARDGYHLGIAYHEYWKEFLYDKYKIKNNIRN